MIMKRLTHIAVFIMFCLMNTNNINGQALKYGAYPKELKPSEIVKSINKAISKYEYNSNNLSSESKTILVESLTLLTELTQDKRYLSLADKINAISVTNEKMDFTRVQKNQFDTYQEISSLPTKNGKKIVDKNLSVKLAKRSIDGKKNDLKELQRNTNGDLNDWFSIGMYVHNTVWAINQPVGMMWLDSYRMPTMRLYLALAYHLKNNNSKGNDPNDVLTNAAFVLASSQMYKLTSDMAKPMPFVTTNQYALDIKTQKKLLATATQPDKATSIALMRKAAEAQLKNTFKGSAGDAKDADRSWYRGSFFTGIMAAWKVTGDVWYLQQAESLSLKNKNQPGPNAIHDANDLNISQVYLELYEAGKAGDYKPTQVYLDSLIKHFNPEKVEWSWCDALYMAPPTWARMGKITGDKKYFDQMDKLWWQTSDLIYDKKAGLFYRDLTYTLQNDGFQIRERNGKNIFWGRGNGWVMGALPRVLDYLPEDYPSRSKYVTMYKEICNSLLKLQAKDGLWRSSLLDPESYPMGETSSSTFYCYAFAWGINRGLLNRKDFEPAVLKAWKSLSALVNPENGRLEYVQLPADSPRSPVYKHCNVEYATGAYLLAGSEVIPLLFK